MTPGGPEASARPARGGFRPGAVVACGLAVALVAAAFSWTGRPPEPRAQAPQAPQALEKAGAYRLRVRGLSPLIQGASAGPARIEIGARLDALGQGAILIEAQLVDEATGRTLWEAAYRGADASPEAIRRLVGEVLRDAMALTKEGAGGDGQEI